MLWLARRDLRHRSGRTAATVVLVALVLTLLFLMTGLVGQFQAEPRLATQRAGGERDWVVPAGTTGPFTSGQTSEAVSGGTLGDVGTPVLVARSAIGDAPVVLVGRTTESSGHSDELVTRGVGVTLDDDLAIVVDESLGVDVGAVVRVGDVEAHVVGLTEDATVLAGVPLVFSNLAFAQRAAVSGAPLVSGYLLDPSAEVTIDESWQRMSAGDVARDAGLPLEDAIGSVDMVRALLWLITTIVVLATTYISALERTRDFAVMKAVGGERRVLSASLVIQSVAVVAAALVLASILQFVARPLFPLVVRLPVRAWWQIPVAAMCVAVVATLVGVRRISSIPASEAFA